MDHDELERDVNELENLFRKAQYREISWRTVWDHVATIRTAFRETQYPSSEARSAALFRFQKIVSRINAQRDEAARERARAASVSAQVRVEIEGLVKNARTFETKGAEAFEFLVGFAIPGYNIGHAYDALTGNMAFKKEKDILLIRSKYMKDAWSKFREEKEKMTTVDRSAVVAELKGAQGVVDDAWNDWKDKKEKYLQEKKAQAEIRLAERNRKHVEYLERQRVREERRNIYEEKRAVWRRRTEANLDKNVERVSKLYQILEDKGAHLERFTGHSESARTDEFRAIMEEKIESVSEQIRDIKNKIAEVEGYIEEDRRKLREDAERD